MDYATSLNIRHAQGGVQSSLDAITTAQSRLNASMGALNSMGQLLVRAQTLAVQQSSGQISAADRQAAAVEVGNLRNQLLGLANQKQEGQSLFAGTATDQAAFTSGAGVTYNGNAKDRIVAITPTQTVVSNVRGDHPAFTQAFASLQALDTALQANDIPSIQSALGQLNAAGNAITDLTSEVGGRVRSLDLQQQSYQDIKVTLEKRLNEHEGVDIPATVAQLQQSSVALQAAYSQVASLRSMSLVQFLR
jgi:flagellin-like hook-associated protein FlgL